MSRQNKNAKNLERARNLSKQRKDGTKGPAKTNPQHGKRWTYRSNPDVAKRVAEQLKVTGGPDTKDKTNGKKILAKAGGASKD